MKLEFKIAQRKENTKSKYVTSITDVKVKLIGNKELIDEIQKLIVDKIVDKDRILY